MPFGMKNSPATIQRLVNKVISGLDGVGAYIGDVIIYCNTWEEHLCLIRTFFDRLPEFQLTVNLNKSEFCHGALTFLGHVVGQGQVKPVFTIFHMFICCKKTLSSFKHSFSLRGRRNVLYESVGVQRECQLFRK